MRVGEAKYQKCKLVAIFYVHMSVHPKHVSKVQPTRCNVFSIYLFHKLLYMFQAVPPPIIRSTKLYI